MINSEKDSPNETGIIIDLGNENEFEEKENINEFEDVNDDNDFLAETADEKETPTEDKNEKVDIKSETTTDSTQALNNDNLINPENEQMLFEKLGKSKLADIYSNPLLYDKN